MKQMDECLDRVFSFQHPAPSKKWKAFRGAWLGEKPNLILLYHYHHLVMVYDSTANEILHEWWEKPTDKRGLDAAKEYLNKKFNTAPR